jgi:Na+/H+-dicarboxylate symporter
MNSGTRALLALAAGLAVGASVRAVQMPMLTDAAKALAPIGALWLTALRMTLVPLIFSLVVSGVGAWAGMGRGGRVFATMAAIFAGLLVASTLTGSGLMFAMLRFWPVAPGALSGLAQAAHAAQPAIPSVTDQIMGLIPANPVAAAAEGAMTPLVVFAVIFGLALSRIDPTRAAAVEGMVQGVGEVMMTIVEWILTLAPVGIFVLALGLALNTGLQAAGAVAQSVIMVSAAPALGIGLCYLIAWIGGGVGPLRFARAAVGPQAVAAGTTSSMATLPAMIEAAETALACPPAVAGAILPLAVSTFRFGNVILIGATMVFAAAASGHTPTLGQVIVAALVTVLTSVGVVGLPAAAVIYAAEAPGFQAMGAPLELLPLFVVTSAIPDIFDTVCNVTADLAVTTIAQRLIGRATG